MLKNYRINKSKLTQEEIAKKLNICRKTYQNIERTNDCKLKIAKKIAEILNDTIENIFFK